MVLGSAVVLSNVAAGAALVFVFGATYFPYISFLPAHRREVVNVADYSDFTLLELLGRSARGMRATELPNALATVLASQPAVALYERLAVSMADVMQVIEHQLLPELTWESVAQAAWELKEELTHTHVLPEHLVAALLLMPALKNWRRGHDLQEHDVRFVAWWCTARRLAAREGARWWDPAHLLDFTGIGLSWTAGFTPLVDRLVHFPAGEVWDQITVGREEQVEQLLTTLARQRQSNVLLVGQPGSGRLGVVQEMARRIMRGTAHPALLGQRAVYLHMSEILARGETPAQQLTVLSAVLAEMERAGNVIAVIDGLGSILGDKDGRVNLSDALLPFFASLKVRVVALLSTEEYHLRVQQNEEISHYFEVVVMPLLSTRQTLAILALATPSIEREHEVYLSYQTLRAIVEDTDGVLPGVPYPERAFDVLEEALVIAAQQHVKKILPTLVHGVVSRKVGMPIGRISASEKQTLVHLEELLHEKVVNQTVAVTAVARAVVRARTGVRTKERPIATFLFLGPTGVGKTETAKALAAAYFGGSEYMIRLDMSEFQTAAGVAQLIGSRQQPVGRLTAAIADRPFTIVLLDEFEKAHRTVQQLFLQVFDEGHLTDARGQEVSFKHAIIIATSNAGAEMIRQAVQSGPLPDDFAEELRDFVLGQDIFRPELLNRFDGVITFTPLTREHIQEIARRMLVSLNKRLDSEHGVTVAVTPELLAFLLERGYHPEFGARPMARAIQDTVEYVVAEKILKGLLTPGQEVVLHAQELQQVR